MSIVKFAVIELEDTFKNKLSTTYKDYKENAIVFIKDTKHIYMNGIYYGDIESALNAISVYTHFNNEVFFDYIPVSETQAGSPKLLALENKTHRVIPLDSDTLAKQEDIPNTYIMIGSSAQSYNNKIYKVTNINNSTPTYTAISNWNFVRQFNPLRDKMFFNPTNNINLKTCIALSNFKYEEIGEAVPTITLYFISGLTAYKQMEVYSVIYENRAGEIPNVGAEFCVIEYIL